jgi:hypothetical protein
MPIALAVRSKPQVAAALTLASWVQFPFEARMGVSVPVRCTVLWRYIDGLATPRHAPPPPPSERFTQNGKKVGEGGNKFSRKARS